MPDNRYDRSVHRKRLVAFAAVLLATSLAAGQPTPRPADPPKSSALKLPDGTVVLYTRNPDEPNPPVDGVLLSGKDYQSLLDQAEQLRELNGGVKPQPPSRCQIKARLESGGGQPVAVLTVIYSFRTTIPRTIVSLGGQRGLPRAAKSADGKLPVLAISPTGLTLQVDQPGSYAITVEFEVPVASRGGNKELGFDIGLPRAPVTSFAFDPPPEGKNITVGTRTADPSGGVARTAYRADAALGPTDLLDVAWEPAVPVGSAVERERTAESDIVVRADGIQTETTATIRLRGPGGEWRLVLPYGADMTAGRSAAMPNLGMGPASGSIAVLKPTDPNNPVWTIQTPEGTSGEWVVTASFRQPRPPADPTHRVTYSIGPVAVPTARHTGAIRVYAAASVGLRFQPGPNVKRQDVAPAAEDDPIGMFRFAFDPNAGATPAVPLLDIETRSNVGFIRIEPSYRLRLTPAGWAMTADLKIAPVRAEVDELRIELPDGWRSGVDASGRRISGDVGGELVDEVDIRQEPSGAREVLIRLTSPQKAPFELSLSAVYTVPPGVRETAIPLPRFAPTVIEQNARLTAEVPAGLVVRGTALGRDRTRVEEAVELRQAGNAGADAKSAHVIASESGAFERGIGQVVLAWQQYRPEVTARIDVDVNVQDRQATVVETVYLRAEFGAWRNMRFRGSAAAAATLNAPLLRQAGEGEWESAIAAGNGEESPPITISYSVPIPHGASRIEVGTFWPVAVTRAETRVRVWGGPGAPRVSGYTGPWRKLPPEPADGRDSLPWLTLSGFGTGIDLALELLDPASSSLPGVWVDRAAVRAWVGADATAVHGRFVVRRWSASGVDLFVPTGVIPDVYVDGRRTENLTPTEVGLSEPRSIRVPIPEPKPDRTHAVLDVWYPIPSSVRPTGATTVPPPRLAGAAYRAPTAWRIFANSGTVGVNFDSDIRPEIGWVWRGGVYAPIPDNSTDAPRGDSDDYQDAGSIPSWAAAARAAASVEVLSARQPETGIVSIYLLPRLAWVAVCSMWVLLVVLGLSRLRLGLMGPAVAAIGVTAAVSAAAFPQPAAEATGGCQPGLWIAAAILAVQAGLRRYQRHRAMHLPGFTRSGYESMEYSASVGTLPRQSANGASGSMSVPLERLGAVNASVQGRG